MDTKDYNRIKVVLVEKNTNALPDCKISESRGERFNT